MQNICGISGNFRLALQVSLETHYTSSLRALAGPSGIKHSCSICASGSTEASGIKQEPRSPKDDTEVSSTEPMVIIKQEPMAPFVADDTENVSIEKGQSDVADDEQSNTLALEKQQPVVPGLDEPYSCGICDQPFKTPSLLRTHFLKHRGKKSFKCTVCGKKFANRQNIHQHLLIHRGDKPYKCDLCSSQYFRSAELVRHKKIHTGEQDYTCQICQKRFTWSHSLKRHLRVHTGERPYTCVYCGNTYKDYGHWRRHKMIHTGEKPYKCNTCEKSFRCRKVLKRHKCPNSGIPPDTYSAKASINSIVESAAI